MLFPTDSAILNVALILAGVAIAWTLIRAVFRITLKLFATGCAVIMMIIVLGTILGWAG